MTRLSAAIVLGALLCANVEAATSSSTTRGAVPVSERLSAPRGARVRWGGVIETITRRGAELTFLVRGHRLGSGGRPRIGSPSAGYFLVVASSRDAAGYAPGAVMTVTGRLSAEVSVVRDGQPRRVPVLRAELRELWPGRVVAAPRARAPASPAYTASPYRSDAGLWLLGSLAVVGALIAADHSYLSIGIGHHGHYGGYGRYRHHRPRYRHHGHAHVGIAGGFHF